MQFIIANCIEQVFLVICSKISSSNIVTSSVASLCSSIVHGLTPNDWRGGQMHGPFPTPFIEGDRPPVHPPGLRPCLGPAHVICKCHDVIR